MDVKRNLIANFAGRAWAALISFLFLPIYVKLLGVEAYGLITVFITLNALIQILDFGLSTTINRELAKLTAVEGQQREARDLVRTLEAVYWLIGLVIALGVMAAAPLAASRWIHANGLSPGAVAQALMIMGLVFAFQWPDSLYAGAMMGLHQQVCMNTIRMVVATVQYVGAALLLAFVSHTIQTFFLWQAVVFAAQTLVLRGAVWRFLPLHPQRPQFQKDVWSRNWRFAAGMTGISLTGAVLTHLDKIVLSKMLTLDALGYYGIATQLGSVIVTLSGPIMSSVFPRFVHLATREDTTELAGLYHKSGRFMAALIFPLGLTVALFSPELLAVYMRDPVKIAHTHLLLSLIVVGTTFNALMALPLSLQLAYGWTTLSFYKNILTLPLFVPALFFMTARYGAVGAAWMWIAINFSYVLVEVPVMHRRLLRGEIARYYLQDIGLPLLVSLGLLLALRLVLPHWWPPLVQVGLVGVIAGGAMLACVLISRRIG